VNSSSNLSCSPCNDLGIRYYLTYGSCCCGCAEGGGQVVFSSRAITGPWARQAHADVNCKNSSALICGSYSKRRNNYANLVYHAQWWGPSFIPLANGTTQVLYLGRRWLSGPHLPAKCFDICGNGLPLGDGNKAHCQKGGEKYEMRSDLSVWHPLEWDEASGEIKPFVQRDSYTLELPDLPDLVR